MSDQKYRNLCKINNYTMGEKIRYLRKQQKLSLGKLADEIGVAKGTLSEIENDSRLGNLSTIIDIANYFDVSIDWLCSRSNVSDTDYDVNFVCNYTGLSADAVMKLSKFRDHEEENFSEAKKLLNEFITTRKLFSLIAAMNDYCQSFDYECLDTNIATYQWRYDIAKEKGLKIPHVDERFFEEETEEEDDQRILLLFKIQEVANSFINDYSSKSRNEYNKKLKQYETIIQKCIEHNKENPDSQSLLDWQLSNDSSLEGDENGNDQETE